MRRKRGGWMNKATDPVLEILADAGIAITPQAIMYELNRSNDEPPSRSTVYRAFKELKTKNYIVNPTGDDDFSLLEITSRGRAYLEGERDASKD